MPLYWTFLDNRPVHLCIDRLGIPLQPRSVWRPIELKSNPSIPVSLVVIGFKLAYMPPEVIAVPNRPENWRLCLYQEIRKPRSTLFIHLLQLSSINRVPKGFGLTTNCERQTDRQEGQLPETEWFNRCELESATSCTRIRKRSRRRRLFLQKEFMWYCLQRSTSAPESLMWRMLCRKSFALRLLS